MTHRHAVLFALVALCTVGLVLADGIIIQSPTGTSLDPEREKFTFSVDSYETISECRLLIDGNTSKRAVYNEVIKGRSLNFAADYEDGTYAWSVECDTVGGLTFASEPRTVTIDRPETTVEVTPSGAFRGSMLHSFTLTLSKDQAPVVIPKIAAGDYLGITIKAYPSKITKELYVKSRLSDNGVPKLWMTYKQEDYYVKEGENVTVPIGTNAHVILEFRDVTLNRATLVAYPLIDAATDTMPEPDETETPDTPTPQEEPVDETPQQPEPTQEPQPPQETPDTDAGERPGAFSRFLSWLVSLFGA